MTQELDTYIRLLYGKPRPTREYLRSIPQSVLRKTAKQFMFVEDRDSDSYIITVVVGTLLASYSTKGAQAFYDQLEANLKKYHDAGT